MKIINRFAVSFLFAAVFAVSAFAQAGAQPGASRIGWIDTGAFADEKEGVTKYINALKALDAEMKPRATELKKIQTKLNAVKKNLQTMTGNTAISIDLNAVEV